MNKTNAGDHARCGPPFRNRRQLDEKCVQCPDLTFSRSNAVDCIKCPVSNAVECVGGQLELEPGYWWQNEASTRVSRRLANVTIVNVVSPASAQRDAVLAGITPDTFFHKCPSDTACVIGPNQRSSCVNGTHGYALCALADVVVAHASRAHTPPRLASPLCAVCDEDYAMSGTTCVQCWPEWQSVMVTACLLTMMAIGTAIVVSRGGTKRSVAMGIVRILVNYMQTVRVPSGTAAHKCNGMRWCVTCGMCPCTCPTRTTLWASSALVARRFS